MKISQDSVDIFFRCIGAATKLILLQMQHAISMISISIWMAFLSGHETVIKLLKFSVPKRVNGIHLIGFIWELNEVIHLKYIDHAYVLEWRLNKHDGDDDGSSGSGDGLHIGVLLCTEVNSFPSKSVCQLGSLSTHKFILCPSHFQKCMAIYPNLATMYNWFLFSFFYGMSSCKK